MLYFFQDYIEAELSNDIDQFPSGPPTMFYKDQLL